MVEATRFDKLVVVALLYDISVLYYENNVGVLYGGKAVSDYKAGLVFHELIHSVLYLYLGA